MSAPRALCGHDHAVAVYEGRDDLLSYARAFIQEGLARNEVVLFAHSFAPKEVERELGTEAEISQAIQDGQVLLAPFPQVLEGKNGRLDGHHVAAGVATLLATAARQHRSGVRILVDASHHYLEHAPADWTTLEMWLGVHLEQKVGLVCLYRKGDLEKMGRRAQVMRIHGFQFDPRRFPGR